jgi:hypothetical protein
MITTSHWVRPPARLEKLESGSVSWRQNPTRHLTVCTTESTRATASLDIRSALWSVKHQVRGSFNAVVFGVGGVSVGTEPETTLLPTRKR